MSPHQALALQHTVGNRVMSQMIGSGKTAPIQRAPIDPSHLSATNPTPLGNQAMSQLIEDDGLQSAQRKASVESVTPVSAMTQNQIDEQRSAGRSLDATTRAEMEPILGADLGDVRLHDGPDAAHLSRQLGAAGFTQGRDVFIGDRHRRGPSARREVVAHELTHAAEDRASLRHDPT